VGATIREPGHPRRNASYVYRGSIPDIIGRAPRQAAGLYQTDIARAVPCHRTNVAHAEAGDQLPNTHFWETADRVVGAKGALVARYDALIQARQVHMPLTCKCKGGRRLKLRRSSCGRPLRLRAVRRPLTTPFAGHGGSSPWFERDN
jgi:hypothetical protein